MVWSTVDGKLFRGDLRYQWLRLESDVALLQLQFVLCNKEDKGFQKRHKIVQHTPARKTVLGFVLAKATPTQLPFPDEFKHAAVPSNIQVQDHQRAPCARADSLPVPVLHPVCPRK
jgi:hypothetical protein